MNQAEYHITAFQMLYNIIQKKCQNAVKDLGITMSQGGVIAAIMEDSQGQITLKDLEKKLQLSQSVTAGLVSRLEQKGFVESFGCEEDKRIKIIRVTPLGKEKCQAGQEILMEVEEEILEPLSDAEKDDMYKTLRKLLDHNK